MTGAIELHPHAGPGFGRSRKRHTWSAVALAIALGSPAAAAPDTPAPVLSLAEALARAPAVAEAALASAESAAAAARVGLAARPAAPLLGLGTTRYSGSTLVTLSEEVRWGGQRHYAVQAAQSSSVAARATAADTAAGVRSTVRHLWFELARAEATAELSHRVVADAGRLAEATAARVEGGRSPRVEWLRASAAKEALAAEALAAEEGVAVAWGDLAAFLGLDAQALRTTGGERPAVPELAAIDALADPARLALHPAVVAAQAELDAARAGHELARRLRLPGLGIEVGMTSGDPGLPGTDAATTVTLAFPLTGAPATSLADAELAAARARFDAVARAAQARLSAAAHRCRGERARWQALEVSALPAAETAAALLREAWEAGRGQLVEVLDADRSLLDVRSASLGAWVAVQEAWADLLYAADEGKGDDVPN
ncbi:MAG: TolC family protein [Thermoanaerobaculia bacterium]